MRYPEVKNRLMTKSAAGELVTDPEKGPGANIKVEQYPPARNLKQHKSKLSYDLHDPSPNKKRPVTA